METLTRILEKVVTLLEKAERLVLFAKEGPFSIIFRRASPQILGGTAEFLGCLWPVELCLSL